MKMWLRTALGVKEPSVVNVRSRVKGCGSIEQIE